MWAQVLLLLVTLAVVSSNEVSSMRYRATSFSVPDPVDSEAFFVKYFGAKSLRLNDFITHRDVQNKSVVSAVRFLYSDGEYFDLYFKKTTSPVVSKFQKYLRKIHRFDIEETWDQYQDWHMAVQTTSLDNLAYQFQRDGIPFITRSYYSLYFEIPNSGFTIQVRAATSKLVWTEAFNFCRMTNGDNHWNQVQQPLNLSNIALQAEPKVPEYQPSHHSYFSAEPGKALDFVLNYTSSKLWVPDFNATHLYGDGTCAMLKWSHFQYHAKDYFQIHFVWNFRKYGAYDSEHPCGPTEAAMEKANRHAIRNGKQGPWMDYRLVFTVDKIADYLKQLQGADYYIHNSKGTRSLFMAVGSLTIELVEFTSNKISPVQAYY